MDGKGWKPHYGISEEGIRALGYLEALPKDVRNEIADQIGRFCSSEGFVTLHDDVHAVLNPGEPRREAKVIPFPRARLRSSR